MARGSSFRGRGGFRGGSFRSRGSNFYRGRGRGRGGSAGAPVNAPTRDDEGTQLAERFEQVRLSDEIDEKIGFPRIQEGQKKEGWLINMHPACLCYLDARFFLHAECFGFQTLIKDADWPSGKAAVDYYFIEDDGNMFKVTYQYEPYFCIACKVGNECFKLVSVTRFTVNN
jgi:DNA polymerase epsilon subunit 1